MAEFLRVGHPAPDFEAEAVVDQEFVKIKLSSYQKNGFKTPCFQHGFILQYSEYRRAYGNSRLRS